MLLIYVRPHNSFLPHAFRLFQALQGFGCCTGKATWPAFFKHKKSACKNITRFLDVLMNFKCDAKIVDKS